MKKIYYLSTCNTCKRVLEELCPSEDFVMQDLKTHPISEEQLDELKELSGSYESLFNRRAQLYRKYELSKKELTEEDYKNYILEHYTFLKRPIVIANGVLFSGSPSKIVANAKLHI